MLLSDTFRVINDDTFLLNYLLSSDLCSEIVYFSENVMDYLWVLPVDRYFSLKMLRFCIISPGELYPGQNGTALILLHTSLPYLSIKRSLKLLTAKTRSFDDSDILFGD